MPSKTDDETKRRLVYVKKLYLHGHEHIPYQTEFDRMIAIHHFDNAIELLLKCVATKLGIDFKNPLFVSFPNLWDAISKKTPLPKKTEIFQLHDFRSNVQHWGISPFSSEVVNRFDVYVADFIREVTEQVFGLNFDQLFMSSLVEDETLRKILTIAEESFEKKNYAKCMRFADAAFNEALWRKQEELGFFLPSPKREFLEEVIDKISILALGVDYLNYKKYMKYASGALWDDKEKNIRYARPLFEDEELEKKLYSRENALFAFNFALDCILRWHL
jgi:hypothetical protein